MTARIAGFWMNETTGVLRPAVEAYLLSETELSAEHAAALRAYFRQWIHAEWAENPEVTALRADIDGLTDRRTIHAWLDRALDAGIDPL